MRTRQQQILRALSSSCVGSMAFCFTAPVVIILGGILLGPQGGHAFFSTQDAILFLVSMLGALIVAIFVGKRYYRFLEKSQ